MRFLLASRPLEHAACIKNAIFSSSVSKDEEREKKIIQ